MAIKRINLKRDIGDRKAGDVLDVEGKELAKSKLKAGTDYQVIGTVPGTVPTTAVPQPPEVAQEAPQAPADAHVAPPAPSAGESAPQAPSKSAKGK
jgi:hypothetical protein